ncbi:MAG: alpha/beta hydrolase [Oscillatoriales cyanobacterium RM2_1_1]|nr:alpha/beta hydrolase [Oscillatoriales cyanobacterium SM2_3_0]NJO44233.1 alpha/beta hydrolase [Oscillatoriales cyanobacterium RM2_1_1]
MRRSTGSWFDQIRPFTYFRGSISKYISLGLAMVLSVTASWMILTARPATAVEELQLQYGAANIAIGFDELETFAETGEQSNQLRSLFTLASLTEPQIADFRKALNFGVEVPADIVDSLLDSSYGRLALGAVGLFIKSGSDIDQIIDRVLQSIRAATRDGSLTVLELIVGYKGIDVISINVERLVDLYEDIVALGEKAVDFLRAQPEVQRLICEQ